MAQLPQLPQADPDQLDQHLQRQADDDGMPPLAPQDDQEDTQDH